MAAPALAITPNRNQAKAPDWKRVAYLLHLSRALDDIEESKLLPERKVLKTAVLVCLAYYLGARLGFALTLKPSPISTLWPPNSIVLAALLLTPTRSWWLVLLLGALPAHLAVQLPLGLFQ